MFSVGMPAWLLVSGKGAAGRQETGGSISRRDAARQIRERGKN